METLKLGKSDLESSRLVYGCMRIMGDNSTDSRAKARQAIRSAYEAGFTHFDHADIYGDGECEVVFSEVLKENPELRDNIIITSKCGIQKKDRPNPGDPPRYNFSKNHIIEGVEGSLTRLGIDTLDVFLLHRPDYLFQAEEVAGTLQSLQDTGKVRYVGVSNFRPSQLSLLQSFCDMPLIMNQVAINIQDISTLLDGTLDQCQELQITPEAFCPMGGLVYPFGTPFTEDDKARLQTEFDLQAKKYNVEKTVILLAWLLKHPAKIVPIIGSTKPKRIIMSVQALDVAYSREDWYRLLEARNGRSVP